MVDASQGVEAQTLANVYLALEGDLTIIPVSARDSILSPNGEVLAPSILTQLIHD